VLGQPNLNIKINREAAARYGLNTGDVNSVVEAALGGTQATTVLEGDRQFSLTVRMAPSIAAVSTRSATSRWRTRPRMARMPIFR
jgi:Cu/Ag efflux pump CusA